MSEDLDTAVISQPMGLTGWLVIELHDEAGNLKHYQATKNLVTTAGDQYYATRGANSVVPGGPSDPAKVTGMKLGNSSTAAAKSSTGAALVTYKTGSNVVFDAAFPTVTANGGDTGYNINYRVTWPAGTATDAALTEVAIVNDASTNLTSTAANTIARATFTAVNKGASDSLTISWSHLFLGA